MAARVGRAAQAAAVRREVLGAALEAFLTDGYHGATLDRIAAEAGYTKGAVYSRYESKADLFLALLEERIESRIEQNERLARGHHGVEGLIALAQRWSEIQRTDMAWTLLVVEFRVHAARHPELLARYAALHRRTLAALGRLFAQVLDGDEEAAADHERTAQVLLSASNGAILEQAVDPRSVPPEVIARLVDALVGREVRVR